MIISTSLVGTPFVSSTDSTRLQMSSKQLSQTLTHFNCKRPYVIGKEWPYLTNTTRLFRLQAPYDGTIVYSNNEIMIILYDESQELKIVSIPEYFHTSYNFATRLRYKHPVGDFSKNDIIYEYDNFTEGIPSYGYNVNTAYFPFFGVNFEDCIVISESLSNTLRSQKIEKKLIPIYTYTLLKYNYPDSKFGFIPEVNQTINKNIIATTAQPTYNTRSPNSIKSTLRNFNLYDFSSVINDSINFDNTPIISKLYDAKVRDIRIHIISNRKLIDKKLQEKIELLKKEYITKVAEIGKDIASLFGEEFTKTLIGNHYVLSNPTVELPDISIVELCYVIEVELIKDEGTKIGDKLSNRYAGKGVVGLIIPDELRPYNKHTKEPIDLILGPLSIYGRSNFSTVLEGLLAKTVNYCEKKILDKFNPEYTHTVLNKLSGLAELFHDEKYKNEILELSHNVKVNHDFHRQFIDSILNGGMYFEVPNFCNVNIYDLQQYIKSNFDITTNDAIVIKKKLFSYMQEVVKLENIEVPNEDVIYNNIFNSPMYILKLQQLAFGKFSARDLGNYSKASKQPTQNIHRQNKGSHLGSMEFDALIAHNNLNTIREFHTVKSDSVDMKHQLLSEIMLNNQYEVPIHKTDSYTKLIIDALMTFLSKN